MNQNDSKQHSQGQHGHSAHQDDKKHAPSGVTTNPENVGAGGGSTPLGHSNQDSRTWGAHDDQKNQDQKHRDDKGAPGKGQHMGHQADASKDAGGRMVNEQRGNPGHQHGQGTDAGRQHEASRGHKP